MIKRLYFIFQANTIVAILSLVVTILSAKYLGASGRGIIALFMSYVAIAQLFSDVIGGGIVLYLLRKFRVNEILMVSYLWFFITVIIAYFVLEIFHFLDKQTLVLLTTTTFFSATFLSQSRIVLNKTDLKRYNFLIISQPAIFLISLIVNGLKEMTIQSFLIHQLISYIIVSICSLWLLKKQLIRKVRIKQLPILTKYAIKLGVTNQLATGLQVINYRSPYFFLEKFSTLSNVGVFNILMSVCNALWLFATGAGILSGNQIASNGINKTIINEIKSYLKWSFIGTLLLSLIFYLSPNWLILIILNKDFSILKRLIIWMIPAIIIFSSSKVLGFYFSATGNTKINLKGSFFGVFPSLILGFYLIQYYGIIGAVISLSSSLIVSAAILFYHFRAETNHHLIK